ncbi:hypothetical protein RGV59_26065 [Pseudomonas sp. FG1]|uniref:hypothetical protein n=1 Tax=Pseudomonas sp. FG1 TaxID=3048624 RepID=UPI002AB4791E|nr:hypothetical protein [Pseudomonas sp. FG1]MDY7554218.1 hypothetical protein [Pseudomonas sp. FG1]MEB0052292.1 hypothetical protein [Pseudomonas sp. FG1]
MKITFSPQRRDDSVTYQKEGETIIVDGEAFDFSQVEEGDVLPRDAIQSEWFSGDVTRSNGNLEIGLILPNPWNYSQEQAFPAPLTITQNGLIELPKPLPIVQKEQVSE